jgi:hypothetical protein
MTASADGERMTTSAGRRCKRIAAAMLIALPLMAPSASAAPMDQIRANKRIGPIRFGDTTMREAKSWFGAPTSRRRMRLGCIRAIRVRWGRKLEVFFTTTKPHAAIEGTVRRRTTRSRVHGRLTIHTRKGLRVGDRNRRIRKLHPNARPLRHGNHWDYFLVPATRYGRLVAITHTKRGRVAALFAGPYENC